MTPPKICEHWTEHKGLYAGIAKGLNGESDGHIVLLDAMPKERNLNYAQSIAWVKSLGNGAKLPNFSEAGVILGNLGEKIAPRGSKLFYANYFFLPSRENTGWLRLWLSSDSDEFNEEFSFHWTRAIKRIPV